MFIINDAKKELCESINGIVSVIKSFYDLETLKDSRYTLYAYVEITDNNLYVKFGEAKKQTIYARYHRGTATKANDRMIGIWESTKGDKEIHSRLKIRSKNNRGYSPADKAIINTEEVKEAYKTAILSLFLTLITLFLNSIRYSLLTAGFNSTSSLTLIG